MIEGMIQRGRGLVDLIAGKTPTLVDWSTDPTDAADITDGDITTVCTTGNKVAGAAWQYAYLDWDLGSLHNVLCTGVGNADVTAGNSNLYVYFWDGSAWMQSTSAAVSYTSAHRAFVVFAARCSKVRIALTSDAAAGSTITPSIREFNVWRL